MTTEIHHINPIGSADPFHYSYSQMAIAPVNARLGYAGQLGDDETEHPVAADLSV